MGKRGLEFLRGFVTFAAEGGRRRPDSGRSGFPVNAFEADIQAELERRGLECEPQWGASSYRIDIAVKHPVDRGRFVLAVECDGATYHSAPTARDRDRLRQEHLELLGWRFCRIWSTDWFLRRDQEVDRVMAAYRAAVAAADATPPPSATPVERPAPRAPEPQPEPAAPTASRPTRSPPPPSIPGQAIDDYSTRELNDLARWVLSDGQLRTEDEILEEMMTVLGFKRRGTRIVARLTQVIQHVRGAR
jgi:very-short-patch-repair endonuclease